MRAKKIDVHELYLSWIYAMIFPYTSGYHRLCQQLYDIDFRFSVPMDMNREEDGIALRYRFTCESDIDGRIISSVLDNKPCSVLEMMAALALRCEEDIMSSPENGDRTSDWFWRMLCSLNIQAMTDDNYNEKTVERAINRMLDRQYASDGKGGLFTVHRKHRDMRKAEIWYQMCWYMDELLYEMEESS